jgi:hypothetical protein
MSIENPIESSPEGYEIMYNAEARMAILYPAGSDEPLRTVEYSMKTKITNLERRFACLAAIAINLEVGDEVRAGDERLQGVGDSTIDLARFDFPELFVEPGSSSEPALVSSFSLREELLSDDLKGLKGTALHKGFKEKIFGPEPVIEKEETPDIDYSLRDKEIPLSQQILKLAAYKTIEYKIGETRYILPLELRGELDRDCFSAAFMLETIRNQGRVNFGDLHRSITKNLSAAERIKYFGKKYEQKLAASVNQLTALWFETPDGDFEQLVSVSESESGGSIVELNEKAVITTNYWKIGHREVAKELKVLTKQPRELEPFLVPNLNDVDQKAGEIQLVDREWLESITTAEKFLKGEPAGFSHQDAIRLLDVSVSIPAILELRKRLEDQQLHFSRSSIVELRKESLRILEWQRFSIALQQRSVKGNLAIKNTSRRRVRLTSGQVAPLQTTDNLFLIVA